MTKLRGWLPLLAVLATCRLAGALEIAILPPVADDSVAASIRSAVSDLGVTVSVLDPSQVIDGARFTPSIYALAVLVGGEHYPDTVITEGDAGKALQSYVDAGGALLVAGAGPTFSRPQRWSGADWRTIPAPVRRVQLLTRFGLLDAGQPLESAPPKAAQFVIAPNSPLSARLGQRFDQPAVEPYRPIPGNQDPGVEFTPLATLVDAQGGTYGAGVAQMRRPADSKGTVFYAWAPLLSSPAGRDLVVSLLALHASQTMTPDQCRQRDELMAQLGQLQKQQKLVEAVVPAELHTTEVDGLRKQLQDQMDTVHWLREATAAGNLNFVALRIRKLRDDLGTMPARAGLAVDRAVQEAVLYPPGPRTAVPFEPPKASTGQETTTPEAAPASATAPVIVTPHVAQPADPLIPATAPRPVPLAEPQTSAGDTPRPGDVTAQTAPQPAPTAIPATTQPTELVTPPADPRKPVTPVPTTTTVPPTPAQPAQPANPTTVATAPATTTPPVTTPPATTATTPPVTTPPATTPTTAPARRFNTDNPVIALEVKGRGTLYVELYPKDAPKTASSFLYLIRSGFYEGTYFHRRVERFVVQGGDPTSRTHPPDDPVVGTGGPDWTVPGEFSDKLTHQRGTVGLAHVPNDPDSGGSQFYICLEPQPTLDHLYAIFGSVIDGLDVIDKLQVGDRIVSTSVVQGAEAKNPVGAKPLELFSKRP